MKNVELLSVSAADSSIVYKFTPSQHYANLNNVVHGGAFGVLFDMFTMSALGTISCLDYWEFMGGVSRSINMSFIRAVPVGKTIYFRCKVVQHGRTMALIRGLCTDESGKTVYATAEHHKVNVPSLKEHKQERIPYDDLIEKEAKEKRSKQKL